MSRDVEFEFKPTYNLQSTEAGIDLVLNRLGKAGGRDALFGLGVAGQVSLEFVRDASSAEEAVRSAVEDVNRALPEAKLVNATPHLAGLT